MNIQDINHVKLYSLPFWVILKMIVGKWFKYASNKIFNNTDKRWILKMPTSSTPI